MAGGQLADNNTDKAAYQHTSMLTQSGTQTGEKHQVNIEIICEEKSIV